MLTNTQYCFNYRHTNFISDCAVCALSTAQHFGIILVIFNFRGTVFLNEIEQHIHYIILNIVKNQTALPREDNQEYYNYQ